MKKKTTKKVISVGYALRAKPGYETRKVNGSRSVLVPKKTKKKK